MAGKKGVRRFTPEDKARAVQIALPLIAQGVATRALTQITGMGEKRLFQALQRNPHALQARLQGIDIRCQLMFGVPERVIDARRVRARLRLTAYRELHGLPPIPVGRRKRADPLKAALGALRRIAAQGPQGGVAPAPQAD